MIWLGDGLRKPEEARLEEKENYDASLHCRLRCYRRYRYRRGSHP